MSASLPTPSASPSVAPPDRRPLAKRPRLTEKGSSTPPTDVDSARRASTLRVLNVWAQLAERYNKRLDEDDIVDLYSCAIIKDRGVLGGASKDYNIGDFAQPDDGQEDSELEQEQEQEQDDDADELDTLSLREGASDDDNPLISRKALLRRVPPLSITTDADDLNEFLEAEKKRKELAGDEETDEEDSMSAEGLVTLRRALAERRHKKAEETRVPPSDRDEESDDELGFWEHDESTAVHPVAQDDSEQDIMNVERQISETTESDEEFELLLQRPSRSTKPSSPVLSPRRATSSHSAKSTPKSKPTKQREHKEESNTEAKRKPVPEVVIPKHSRRTAEEGTRDKGRDILPSRNSCEDEPNPRETTFKPSGIQRRKKRKRVPSSSTSHKSDDDSQECRGRPRSTSPASSSSIFTPHQRDTSPSPNYAPFGREPVAPLLHEYDYDTTPRSQPPAPLPHPHPHHQRHPSHAPPIYPPPTTHQTTPGPPLHSHHPPPIDPMQTQQAQYLLAQAMHQLTYLMSASMPAYSGAYSSSPGQPWHQPPFPPPPPPQTYATPSHHARSQSQPNARPYHARSSSLSHSTLPPSSPPPRPRSRSVSPHPRSEERCAPSRARSKSRGRRVSFRLGNEEVALVDSDGDGGREGREGVSSKRDKHPSSSSKAKGKKKESRDTKSRSEERADKESSSPPPRRIVARGRTPGPPSPRPHTRQKS